MPSTRSRTRFLLESFHGGSTGFETRRIVANVGSSGVFRAGGGVDSDQALAFVVPAPYAGSLPANANGHPPRTTRRKRGQRPGAHAGSERFPAHRSRSRAGAKAFGLARDAG